MSVLAVRWPSPLARTNQLSLSQHLPSRYQHLELVSSWRSAASVQFAAVQGVGINLLEARFAEHRVSLPQLGQGFRGERNVGRNVEAVGHIRLVFASILAQLVRLCNLNLAVSLPRREWTKVALRRAIVGAAGAVCRGAAWHRRYDRGGCPSCGVGSLLSVSVCCRAWIGPLISVL